MQLFSNVTRRSALLMAGSLFANGLLLAGCSQETETTDLGDETDHDLRTEPDVVRVASLKGPTSIGLVSLMDSAQAGNADLNYEFTIATSADEIVPNVVKGDIDIALLPANAAAVLYNKTDGEVSVLNINTLGVLNVVTGDDAIQSFADLANRTVYLTGKGAVPEYTMNYLLEQAGIADSVTLEFKDEPTEVVATLSADPSAVGVLPQPFATVAVTKNEGLSIALDLTDVWNSTVTDGSQLVTGVTVIRKEFALSWPDVVKTFMEEQAASVEYANGNPDLVAPLVVEAGIIDNEAIAAKAIPSCHLVCIAGDEMKESLQGYLQTLYDTDPSSVGGTLPANDFYYEG